MLRGTNLSDKSAVFESLGFQRVCLWLVVKQVFVLFFSGLK
jgi:hypothetical protein